MNRKVLSVMVCLFGLGMISACSKNMMPPEAAQLGGAITESEMSESRSSAVGSASSGFNIDTEGGSNSISGSSGSGSGFFREEDVGESASSGSFVAGGPQGSSGRNFGNGFSGNFEADEPFSAAGDSGNSGGSRRFAGNGGTEEEARLGSFVTTSELKDIHFKFDRYDLDDQSRATLRENVNHLKANPSTIIEVQGHCDERGTNNYNIALGERRAQSTKMYMVSQGVSSRRIHTISYGEERPFCFDSNAGCWSKNRRAHFRIGE